MAARHSCWVIVADSGPTAFHGREREDLLPTLKQLQRTQPDAALKWFERGRLWESPIQADEALRTRRMGRGAGWRPGGVHADPRAKYEITRDEKRARHKRLLIQGKLKPKAFGDRPSGPPKKRRDDGDR